MPRFVASIRGFWRAFRKGARPQPKHHGHDLARTARDATTISGRRGGPSFSSTSAIEKHIVSGATDYAKSFEKDKYRPGAARIRSSVGLTIGQAPDTPNEPELASRIDRSRAVPPTKPCGGTWSRRAHNVHRNGRSDRSTGVGQGRARTADLRSHSPGKPAIRRRDYVAPHPGRYRVARRLSMP